MENELEQIHPKWDNWRIMDFLNSKHWRERKDLQKVGREVARVKSDIVQNNTLHLRKEFDCE